VFHQIIKTTIFSITALISTQACAIELNLNLVDNSALTILSDTDWTMLRATAKDALNNSADGSSHVWKNNDTSNAGVITILSTNDKSGSFCRNTRFINTAGELTAQHLLTYANKKIRGLRPAYVQQLRQRKMSCLVPLRLFQLKSQLKHLGKHPSIAVNYFKT